MSFKEFFLDLFTEKAQKVISKMIDNNNGYHPTTGLQTSIDPKSNMENARISTTYDASIPNNSPTFPMPGSSNFNMGNAHMEGSYESSVTGNMFVPRHDPHGF